MFEPTDTLSQVRWLDVSNDSGEDIPAYAVMRVTGYDSDTGAFLVGKPDANDIDPTVLLVNGPGPIPTDEFGRGTKDYPILAAVTSGSAAAEVGTVSGSWSLATSHKGFRLWQDVSGGVAVVNAGIRFLWDVSCDDGTPVGTAPSA
jgi:hypothetical protein